LETNRIVTIGGTQIHPGERATIDLPFADLYTHTKLLLPVHVINGKRPGPTVFLTAALHGDELNGVEIIRQFLRLPGLRRLSGCVLAIPVVNVFGFINRSRYLPDRRDLNRVFPGSETGSIGARLARLLGSEIISQCDYGIDLHTGAVNRTNLPQIRANLDDPETARLAMAFGTPVVIDAAMRPGSLREYAAGRNVRTIVYESGEALRFDELSIRVGVNGIRRVLRELDMLPQPKNPKAPPQSQVAHSTTWVRADGSGVFRTRCRLGDAVERDRELGVIGDPFSATQVSVRSPVRGVVIGRSTSPLTHEGDALFHIARFDDDHDAEGTVDALQETHSVEFIWG
jgi:predicted deacylase